MAKETVSEVSRNADLLMHAFQTSADAIIVIENTDDANIIFYNNSSVALFEPKLSGSSQIPLKDFFHILSTRQKEELQKKLKSPNNEKLTLRIKDIQEAIRWVELSFSPIADMHLPQRTTLIARDISDYKSKERLINDIADQNQELLANSKVVNFSLDHEGNIIHADHNFSDYFTDNAVLDYFSIDSIFNSIDQIKSFRIFLKSSLTDNELFETKDKSGLKLTLRFYKKPCPFGYQITAIDVSQVRAVEKELKMTSNKLKILFNFAPIGIALCLGDGEFIDCNQALIDMLGYSRKDFARMSLISPEFLPAEALDKVLNVQKIMNAQPTSHKEQLRVIKKDGDSCDILVYYVSLYLDGDIHVFCFVSDISKEIKQKEELEALNGKLDRKVRHRTEELEKAHSDLLVSLDKEKELSNLKSQFVKIVSHEFRTPLQVILSYSSLINEYWESNNIEKFTSASEAIQESVLRMNSLIQEVLTFGSADYELKATEFQMVDIADIVNTESQRLMNIHPHQKIVINAKADCSIWSVPRIIEIATSNLIQNAIKYNRDFEPIIIELYRDNNFVYFDIFDCGIGIPAQDHDIIFDSFRRGSNTIGIEGTGLGLHMVRNFLQLIGGEIMLVRSRPGNTVFRYKIPIRSESSLS